MSFRWRCQTTYRIAIGMGPWLVGFWQYFTSSYGIVIGTNYSLEQTRQRLLELNKGRDVHVRINAQGQMYMNATAHAWGGKGTPMIPELCAQFQNDATCSIMTGSIGVNSASSLFVWFFLATLLVCEFVPGVYEAFHRNWLFPVGDGRLLRNRQERSESDCSAINGSNRHRANHRLVTRVGGVHGCVISKGS